MKKSRLLSGSIPVALLIFLIMACNMSTANLSDLTISKDKEGKQITKSFKNGETINAVATVSNNPGKVKVKTYLVAEDAKGVTKGETIEGSEVTVEIDGDGRSEYTLPVSEGFPAGKYKLIAEMINEEGETKDTKTSEITIEKSAKTDNSDADKAPNPDDEPEDDAPSEN